MILVPGHWLVAKGGSEYQAHLLADHIARTTSHEVVYLAREVPEANAGLAYRVCRVPSTVGHFRLGLYRDWFVLLRTLRALRPDVIVQRLASAYTGIAAYYCKRNAIPLIWCTASDRDVHPGTSLAGRSPGRLVDRFMFKYGLRGATHIVTQTRQQAFELEKNYGIEATAVIPNFHPDAEESIQKGEHLIVLWIANFKRLKQPEVFIRLARHFTNAPEVEFRMIGRMEESEWGRQFLRDIESTPNLEYVGELDNDQVNHELAKASLLVNTSTYEGFSNTFIQAWKREVPVLSLNVDPDQLLSDTGLGVRAGSFEGLTRALEDLCSDRDRLGRMGSIAKGFADSNFSMANADKLLDVIESSTAKCRAGEISSAGES